MHHRSAQTAARVSPRQGATTTAPTGAPPATPPDRNEQLFLDWLTSADKPETLRLDGCQGPETPLTWVLGVLCTSPRVLPPETAAVLGFGTDRTLGDAATELLLAVNDPAGPRCRSYRSAVLYLRELRGLAEVLDELERDG